MYTYCIILFIKACCLLCFVSRLYIYKTATKDTCKKDNTNICEKSILPRNFNNYPLNTKQNKTWLINLLQVCNQLLQKIRF